MRIIARIAAGAAIMLGIAAASAEAMPISPPASLATETGLLQVRDGCGPFGHRSHYGFCKPGGGGYGVYGGGPGFYGRPVYGGPRFYGRPGYYGRPRPSYARRCFIRETYYGPRRVCR